MNPDTGKPFTKALGKVFHNASVKALGYSIGMAKATRTSFAQQLANSGMDIHYGSPMVATLRDQDHKTVL